jgi:enoyl-CoA hydratase
MEASLALAERLARSAPAAIAASKVGVNAYMKSVADIVMPVSLAAESATMQTEDFAEASRAFSERREPRFT